MTYRKTFLRRQTNILKIQMYRIPKATRMIVSKNYNNCVFFYPLCKALFLSHQLTPIRTIFVPLGILFTLRELLNIPYHWLKILEFLKCHRKLNRSYMSNNLKHNLYNLCEVIYGFRFLELKPFVTTLFANHEAKLHSFQSGNIYII